MLCRHDVVRRKRAFEERDQGLGPVSINTAREKPEDRPMVENCNQPFLRFGEWLASLKHAASDSRLSTYRDVIDYKDG